MSDHKWDRFKRAFGTNPSNELIDVRDGKVRAALAQVTAAIDRLTAVGLDASALTGRRDVIERARAQALQLRSNKDKDTVLDRAKQSARSLAEEAAAEADRRIAALNTELAELRQAVKAQVDAAKALKQPLCQTATAVALRDVENAAGAAERQANDEARRAALERIDLDPLKALLEDAKPVETDSKSLARLLELCKEKLEPLPDGDTKSDLDRQFQAMTRQAADLANEVDLKELRKKTEAAKKQATVLFTAIGKEHGEFTRITEQLMALRADIDVVVKAAKAIPNEVGKAAVKSELDKVEKARSDAELLSPDQARLDALKLIDLKPLKLAVAQAQDLDGGTTRLLTGLADAIGKLPDGEQKNGFFRELNQLGITAAGLATERDLETAKRGYAELKGLADALMERALKARGKDGYQDALKARFGVDVRVKDTAKVNLVKTYEMLALVPESHVGHEKMKEVYFNNSPERGASYGAGTITMDNFEDNDTYTYSVDGKKVKPNAFNVCMLHEIGHSVDDKYKIMAGLMEQASYGDWKKETKESVADALTKAALKAMGNPGDPLKGQVAGLIAAALGGKAPAQPGGCNRTQWKALQTYTDIALAIRTDNKPWFNASPGKVTVDGRVYVESYGNDWHSYAVQERAATVRDYQWRAPGEWFADLYGVSWLMNKPPPSGVGNALAQWFPK